MQEFDTDRDGALSPAEIQTLERGHFAETRESLHYVTMRLNHAPVPVDGTRDLLVALSGARTRRS